MKIKNLVSICLVILWLGMSSCDSFQVKESSPYKGRYVVVDKLHSMGVIYHYGTTDYYIKVKLIDKPGFNYKTIEVSKYEYLTFELGDTIQIEHNK